MKKQINILTSFTIIGTLLFSGIVEAQLNSNYSFEEELILDLNIKIDNDSVGLETEMSMISSERNLPNEVSDFVEKYFSNHEVENIIQKRTLYGYFHRVYLNDSVELYFDDKNEIVGIKSRTDIPNNIIPPFITEYMSKHYPENEIVEWKVNHDTQKIVLDSDKHLLLNRKGEFVTLKEI